MDLIHKCKNGTKIYRMGYNILSNGKTIKVIDFGNADSVCRKAKDVEGCKREDWENYGVFETEQYVVRRRMESNNNALQGASNDG